MVYGAFEPILMGGFLIKEIGFILRERVRGSLHIEYDVITETSQVWLVLVYEDRVYNEEMEVNLLQPPINILYNCLEDFQQKYSGLVDLKLGELK